MLTSSLRWCGTDEDDKETLFQLICGPTFRSSVVSFSRVVTKKLNTLETYFRHCTAPSKYPFSCNATHPLVDAEGLHTLPEKVRAIVKTLALQNSSPCWDCFPTTLGSYPTWLQCWSVVSVTDRGRKSSDAGLGSRKVLLIGPRSSWCHCKC